MRSAWGVCLFMSDNPVPLKRDSRGNEGQFSNQRNSYTFCKTAHSCLLCYVISRQPWEF